MLKVHPEPESNYSMRIPLIAVGVTAVGILVLIIMILFSWRQLRTFFRSSTSEGMGKSLLVATHRNGQTFLTWHERTDQSGSFTGSTVLQGPWTDPIFSKRNSWRR